MHEGLADARGVERVGAHDVLERSERHHARADARAVVVQHRQDRRAVVGGDRLAEGEIRREDLRPLLEACLVLREELAEHALALLELLVDRLARDLRGRLDDEEGAQSLHKDEESHEERDDARPETLQPRPFAQPRECLRHQ